MQAIYGKLFDWLVQTINKALQTEGTKTTYYIGILDIFGLWLRDRCG